MTKLAPLSSHLKLDIGAGDEEAIEDRDFHSGLLWYQVTQSRPSGKGRTHTVETKRGQRSAFCLHCCVVENCTSGTSSPQS